MCGGRVDEEVICSAITVLFYMVLPNRRRSDLFLAERSGKAQAAHAIGVTRLALSQSESWMREIRTSGYAPVLRYKESKMGDDPTGREPDRADRRGL